MPCLNVFTVRSGAVKTRVMLESGHERVIGFHAPGDVIGLDAMDEGRHGCDAVVLDTASVCSLPTRVIDRADGAGAVMRDELVRRMSRALAEQQGLLLMLGRYSAEQRVAAFLLRQSRRQRLHGLSAREINLPMSRSDIASYLALAVETVSRVLTRLQELGLLHVRRSQVRILDLKGLEAMAEDPSEPNRLPRARPCGEPGRVRASAPATA